MSNDEESTGYGDRINAEMEGYGTMKRMIWIAGIALALMTGVASANPNCNANGNGTVTDCIANGGDIFKPTTTQNNNQTTTNSNKAYGGNAVATGGTGGAGGAGGAGGNAQQQQQQNQSQSSTSQANNEGNNQSTVFNDRLQAPAVSSFIAASGPCTGISGGGAVSVAGFGIGASFASLEEDCKKRELLRIGFASGNQQIEAAAAQGWMTMYQDAFPAAKQNQQTGSLPVASSTQTASAAVCPDLPMVTHNACMAKASAQ